MLYSLLYDVLSSKCTTNRSSRVCALVRHTSHDLLLLLLLLLPALVQRQVDWSALDAVLLACHNTTVGERGLPAEMTLVQQVISRIIIIISSSSRTVMLRSLTVFAIVAVTSLLSRGQFCIVCFNTSCLFCTLSSDSLATYKRVLTASSDHWSTVSLIGCLVNCNNAQILSQIILMIWVFFWFYYEYTVLLILCS